MDNQLKKLECLGTKIGNVTDDKMDPDNDYYPIPLHCGSHKKYTGLDRLKLAMIYLQVPRFRELLLTEYADNEELYAETDEFNNNLLGMAVCTNHPSNIPYSHNYIYYDAIFWLLLNNCGANAQRMNVANFCGRGRNPVDLALCQNQSHYAFALINHGLYPSDKYIQEITNKHKTNSLDSFIKSDRYKQVISSKLAKGSKLLELCDTCPITTSKILTPVIAEDGHIYEYHALFKWSLTKGAISPMLNEKMSKFVYFITEDRFGKMA